MGCCSPKMQLQPLSLGASHACIVHSAQQPPVDGKRIQQDQLWPMSAAAAAARDKLEQSCWVSISSLHRPGSYLERGDTQPLASLRRSRNSARRSRPEMLYAPVICTQLLCHSPCSMRQEAS